MAIGTRWDLQRHSYAVDGGLGADDKILLDADDWPYSEICFIGYWPAIIANSYLRLQMGKFKRIKQFTQMSPIKVPFCCKLFLRLIIARRISLLR